MKITWTNTSKASHFLIHMKRAHTHTFTHTHRAQVINVSSILSVSHLFFYDVVLCMMNVWNSTTTITKCGCVNRMLATTLGRAKGIWMNLDKEVEKRVKGNNYLTLLSRQYYKVTVLLACCLVRLFFYYLILCYNTHTHTSHNTNFTLFAQFLFLSL